MKSRRELEHFLPARFTAASSPHSLEINCNQIKKLPRFLGVNLWRTFVYTAMYFLCAVRQSIVSCMPWVTKTIFHSAVFGNIPYLLRWRVFRLVAGNSNNLQKRQRERRTRAGTNPATNFGNLAGQCSIANYSDTEFKSEESLARV